MRPCPPSGTGSGVISSSSINVARTAGSVLEPRMVFSLPPCPPCFPHHPAPFHLSTPPNLSQTVRPPLTAVEQLLLAGAPTPVGKHADLGVGEPVDSGSSLRRSPHRGLGRFPASKCSSGAHFWTPLDRAAPLCHGGAGN